ncbi:MAG: sulfate ABC transporter ATP-binding protein [Planctomyces sp.]|nr:sulfate ABC transporter ATP-binding protein [Planctomyces sp.]
MSIRVEQVTKRFGEFTALDRLTVEAKGGELLALLGPSGSGKTTLLRIIAGLEHADEGTVRYEEEDVTGRHPRQRGVGFVFQHYALFRHMTVFDNIGFGLRIRKEDKTLIAKRVRELLHLVRLEGLENRYPAQLSGGQRQRVALARALAVQPKVLLLDEPFGALDAKVRQELRQWLRQLHDELPITTIFVTHDQEEAFEVADRVVVMRAGKIEQVGSPQEVFDHPANPFVMDFLGHVNVFHGRVHDGKMVAWGIEFSAPEDSANTPSATAYVRPHDVDLTRVPESTESIRVKVLQVNPAGAVARVRCHSEEFGITLQIDLSRDRYLALKPIAGEDLFASPRHARIFAPKEDYSI